MSKKWEAVHVDAAFLVVGFLDGEYTGFLARRVKAPSLVMPWFNRPFVARKTPVFHVISIAIDDKLPDKDVSLAI